MRPIRACFLAQHPLSFRSVESVWRSCARDPRFEAQVLVIPALSARAGGPADDIGAHLRAAGIPHRAASRAWLDAWRPDVIFVPSSAGSSSHPDFSAESLAGVARIACIADDFGIGSDDMPPERFDATVHDLAWRVYAGSERARVLHARRGRTVVVTGHPRLDALPAQLQAVPRTAGPTRTVLWTPGHDVRPDGTGRSTFLAWWKALPALVAREFPAMLLVVRPHRRLREVAIATEAITAAEWEEWTRWLGTLGNVLLDESPEPYAVFATSDALLTDGGAFLLEYLPTGRPICHLRHPARAGVADGAAAASHCEVADDLGTITAFLARTARGEDPARRRRLAAAREYLHLVDGRAGERVRDDLARSLRPAPQLWQGAVAKAATPLVSVVIPTFRRAPILRQCLEALARQTFPPTRFEVIVTDDGSGDETESMVRALDVPYALTFLTQANAGPGRARNQALRHARGEIVLILNDDALLEPDAVAIHVERHLLHPEGWLAVLGAFRFPDRLRESLLTRLAEDSALLFHYPDMRAGRGTWEEFYTCNISLRRRDLDAIGHFDERFTGPAGEDIELGIRFFNAGGRLEYEPSCVAWHEHPQSVDGLARVAHVRGLASPLVSLIQPACTWVTDVTPEELRVHRASLAERESTIAALRTSLLAFEKGEVTVPDGPAGVRAVLAARDAVRSVYRYHYIRGLLDSPWIDALAAANVRRAVRAVRPGEPALLAG